MGTFRVSRVTGGADRRVRYLMQNMDWLEEELGGFEDDYLIIDCPGASILQYSKSKREANTEPKARLNCTPIIHFYLTSSVTFNVSASAFAQPI